MNRMALALVLTALSVSIGVSAGENGAPEGWTTAAPRDEIRPQFAFDPKGGPNGTGCFIIRADQREGLDGCWCKTFPIQGGKYYRFESFYKANGVAVPRRSIVAKIQWQDDQGRSVPLDEPAVTSYLRGARGMAETEFPSPQATNASGWTELSDTYRAPGKATQAVIELHLQWAANSEVRWSGVSFTESAAPASRKVRLAAVHFRPSGGKTPMDNCRMYEPLIAEAARQKADLVVLGETVTSRRHRQAGPGGRRADPRPVHRVLRPAGEEAQPVPRGQPRRARRASGLQHRRAARARTASSSASIARSACRAARSSGRHAPGSEYPVFETRFGKVGMMVCYDGFFPEVARELTNRGAEVIAWPVWGCNPLLARARACENHVYLVSSTYEDISRQLDALGGLRPHGRDDRPGERMGHGGRRRGGPEPARPMGEPGRLQSRDPAASPHRAAGAAAINRASCTRR